MTEKPQNQIEGPGSSEKEHELHALFAASRSDLLRATSR